MDHIAWIQPGYQLADPSRMGAGRGGAGHPGNVLFCS